MARDRRTPIEKLTQHLMTVEMYQAKLRIAGKSLSNKTIRNRIDQLQSGEISPSQVGFIPHYIAGKVFIEDTSVAPEGKPVTF